MLTVVLALVGAVVSARLARAAARAGRARRAHSLRARPVWRLPEPLRSRVVRAVTDAGLRLDPEAAVALSGGALVVGAGIGASLAPQLAPMGGIGVAAALLVGLRLARNRRERAAAGSLPAVLEHTAGVLRSGGTLADGLEDAAGGDGGVAADLARVQRRVALGAGWADALAAWPAERPVADVRAAAGALSLAGEVGGPVADALDALASSMRERLAVVADARALSAQARMSAVVVGVAPLGYLAFSTVVDGRAARALLGSGTGRACLVVGVGLEAVAAAWMIRLVRGVAR